MIRITTAFALLTGTVMLLTAGLMRAELTAPGVALFLDRNGDPNGDLYTRVVLAHGGAGAALAGWLGLAFAGLGIRGGARGHRFWAYPALVIPLALTAITAVLIFAPSAFQSALIDGWVLYPSYTDDPNFFLPDSQSTFPVVPALQTACIGLLVAGLFPFLGRFDGFRGFATTGALLTLGLMAYLAVQTSQYDAYSDAYTFFFPMLLLIGGASVLLIDRVSPAVPFLALGGIFAGLAAFFMANALLSYGFADTMVDVATSHMSIYALPLLVFPAFVIALRDRAPHPAIIWGGPVAICVGLFLAFRPLVLLGQEGMPTRYVDYPEAFAPGNMDATLGAGLLGLVLFVLIALIQRSRA